MKRNKEENVSAEKTGADFQRTEIQAFCPMCGRQVGLLTFERAGEILKSDVSEIFEIAETGRIHRLHNARGDVAVCAESLFDVLKTRPTERFSTDIFKTNPSDSKIIF